MKASDAAHGEVILLAEHVVVDGAAALATGTEARRAPTAATLGSGSGRDLGGYPPSLDPSTRRNNDCQE
jgi:hypothetical protein